MRLRRYRVDARSLIERVPFAIPARLGLLFVVAASAAAWAVRFALDANLPPGFPFLTFFPVVIIVAFFLGARLGAVTAVVCGLLSWYSFVPPIDSFQLTTNSAIAMGFYAFITTTEILLVSWMQRANRRAVAEREANAALAETRELLFRELQHRVGNNLQMVASLIALQRRNVSDVQARAALDEASRRLGTIGRISRQLYETSGDGRPLESFLCELIADVIEANGRSDVDHRIAAASDAGAMRSSTAFAIAAKRRSTSACTVPSPTGWRWKWRTMAMACPTASHSTAPTASGCRSPRRWRASWAGPTNWPTTRPGAARSPGCPFRWPREGLTDAPRAAIRVGDDREPPLDDCGCHLVAQRRPFGRAMARLVTL